jgi:hypothetical protein
MPGPDPASREKGTVPLSLEIESDKRDPRLSSIERIADAMELAVMLVPG